MTDLTPKQMEAVTGGDYELCGVGVVLTVASAFLAPWATPQLALGTTLACLSGQ